MRHAVCSQVLEAITAAHKTILAWEANEKLQEWGGDANGHSASAAEIREAAASVRAKRMLVAVLPFLPRHCVPAPEFLIVR
jgi:hypothetical protein